MTNTHRDSEDRSPVAPTADQARIAELVTANRTVVARNLELATELQRCIGNLEDAAGLLDQEKMPLAAKVLRDNAQRARKALHAEPLLRSVL